MPEPIGEQFLNHVVDVLRANPRILAAWLTGSHARGTADRYSDIDLWIVVRSEDKDDFVADWPRLSERVAPSVLRQRVFGSTFLHITPLWQRWDVSIGVPEDVAERGGSTLKLLFDRGGLSDRLGPGPAAAPDAGPDPDKVGSLATEFLRVMGLLPVVLGRDEYIVGVSGAGLLRGLIVQLFVEDSGVAAEDRGGALHLNGLLSPGRLQQLAGLPGVEANRESVLAAHMACAQVFLPAAREIAQRCGAQWPSELETALRQRLRTEFYVDMP